MINNRQLLAVVLCSGALFATPAALAETVAAPAAPDAQTEAMPMPMRGMGMGMGAGMEPCKSKMAMAGHKPPCMGEGGKCKTAGGLEQRIEALEKRLDAMQLSMELLARQGGR